MDSFSQKSEDFLDWFRALPGSTFHKDIALRDLRVQNAGRGIGKFKFHQRQHLRPI